MMKLKVAIPRASNKLDKEMFEIEPIENQTTLQKRIRTNSSIYLAIIH